MAVEYRVGEAILAIVYMPFIGMLLFPFIVPSVFIFANYQIIPNSSIYTPFGSGIQYTVILSFIFSIPLASSGDSKLGGIISKYGNYWLTAAFSGDFTFIILCWVYVFLHPTEFIRTFHMLFTLAAFVLVLFLSYYIELDVFDIWREIKIAIQDSPNTDSSCEIE